MKERKLTVVGLVDPIELVTKLRKLWHADILSVGPAKDGKAAAAAEDQRDGGVMEEGDKQGHQEVTPAKQVERPADDMRSWPQAVVYPPRYPPPTTNPTSTSPAATARRRTTPTTSPAAAGRRRATPAPTSRTATANGSSSRTPTPTPPAATGRRRTLPTAAPSADDELIMSMAPTDCMWLAL